MKDTKDLSRIEHHLLSMQVDDIEPSLHLNKLIVITYNRDNSHIEEVVHAQTGKSDKVGISHLT
jgi:hypothetical protein